MQSFNAKEESDKFVKAILNMQKAKKQQLMLKIQQQ